MKTKITSLFITGLITLMAAFGSRVYGQFVLPPDGWELYGGAISIAEKCPKLALALLETNSQPLCFPEEDKEKLEQLAITFGKDSLLKKWNKRWKSQKKGNSPLDKAFVDTLYRALERVSQPKYVDAVTWMAQHKIDSVKKGKKDERRLALYAEYRLVQEQVSRRFNLFVSLNDFPGMNSLGSVHYNQFSALLKLVDVENAGYWIHQLEWAHGNGKICPLDWALFYDRYLFAEGGPNYPRSSFGTLLDQMDKISPSVRSEINHNRIRIGLPLLDGGTEDEIQALIDYFLSSIHWIDDFGECR